MKYANFSKNVANERRENRDYKILSYYNLKYTFVEIMVISGDYGLFFKYKDKQL